MTVRDVSGDIYRRGTEEGSPSPPRGTPGGAEVRVVHAVVPGRVRLSVPGLRRVPDLVRGVEGRAASWRGVHRAVASATTGSLLLEYDPAATTVQALTAQARTEADRVINRVVNGRAAREDSSNAWAAPARRRGSSGNAA